jgi:hypothetical protein
MSIFSPTAWLSSTRSRLLSSSTADFSKDESFLEGLNYISNNGNNGHGNGNGTSNSIASTAVPSTTAHSSRSRSSTSERNEHVGSIRGGANSSPHHNRNPSDTFEEDEWLKGGSSPYTHTKNHTHNRQRATASNASVSDSYSHNMDLLSGADNVNHYDTFKADITLDGLNLNSQAQQDAKVDILSRSIDDVGDDDDYSSDADGNAIPHPPATHQHQHQHLQNRGSFSNASCISSLSGGDDTHSYFDQHPDEKTVQSLDAINANANANANANTALGKHQHRIRSRPRPIPETQTRQSHQRSTSSMSHREDFDGAFDHLDHLIHPRDLMDDSPIDEHELHQHDRHHDRQREYVHQLAQPYDHHRSHTHSHSHTHSLGGSNVHNLRSQRPAPLHFRSQSDTHSFRPSSASSRGISVGSTQSHQHSHSHSHHHPKQKPVAAHATLRECIVKSKENEHNRLLSSSNKPLILSSRSTSATVQSSSAGSGVVWTGQPIADLVGSTPPPSRMSRKSLSHRSSGSGTSMFGHSQSESFQAAGSGFGSMSASASVSASASASVSASGLRPSSSHSHRSHRSQYSINKPGASARALSEAGSVDHAFFNKSSDDRTTVSTSMDSASAGAGVPRANKTSKRRKNPIKEELKFVLQKLVPSPLKKMTSRRNKVNLERSGGCLT